MWASLHARVVTPERRGLIARTPSVGRSMKVLVPREELPELG